MVDTFISSCRIKVTVNIPDRTLEEQAIRDREIERSIIAIYLKLEKDGKLHILNKTKEVS